MKNVTLGLLAALPGPQRKGVLEAELQEEGNPMKQIERHRSPGPSCPCLLNYMSCFFFFFPVRQQKHSNGYKHTAEVG